MLVLAEPVMNAVAADAALEVADETRVELVVDHPPGRRVAPAVTDPVDRPLPEVPATVTVDEDG
ncbi:MULTISPECIES: hypothetical protein [unclassified Streptomyces]|uniref:hypothetical protein n=1 Tax=unclassified Streptomyces TaxID=2593676 RepID=UPI00332D7142